LGSERIKAVEAEVVTPPLHICRREGNIERLTKDREVLEENLFLQRFRAGGNEDAMAAQNRGDEIGERLSGAGSGLDQQHAGFFEGADDRGGHVALGLTRFEDGQRPGETALIGKDLGDSVR
jgi:hypothetical protein